MTPNPPAPKQAEAFTFGMEKVAWQLFFTDEDGIPCRYIFYSYAHLDRHIQHNTHVRGLHCVVVPLVRLTDAQSALLAQAAEKDAEIDRLRADAERYRWLREQGTLTQHYRHPHFEAVHALLDDLGGEFLDDAIDTAKGK